MGTGELGHDQSAAALVADQAAEDRVGDSGHGRQHGRGRDADAAPIRNSFGKQAFISYFNDSG